MGEIRGIRFATRLRWVVGFLLAVLAVLVAEAILTSRRQHEEQAVVETYSVARVLESDVGGLVDKVRLALHTVATERGRHLATPGADDRAIRAYIASIHANLPDVVAIRIADAAGRVVFRTELAGAPLPGVEGEPYFARLRDGHSSRIVFSAPHRDGPDGQRVIDVALGVEHPDGRFGGAIIAPIPIGRLVTMLAAADVGHNGAVSLRGEELSIVARFPYLGEGSARDAAPAALRQLVDSGEISGTFHAISPIDGVERLYSYRRIAGYPLHITVGRATAEYLGHWRRDMGVVVALALVLLAVTLAAAVMIDRAWERQRRVARLLEMQAHTDALTGLANRRRFFEMADAELARARRYGVQLSLLMLDIDLFKEVNDAHGHRAGDRVLQQLALTCLSVLRTVDVVGRVGGEEFAILLPETTLEGAAEVAERLREAVAAAEVARDEGVPLRITVSIGVASLEGAKNLDTLMSQADDALYVAKHEGRNRVSVAGNAPMPASGAAPGRNAPSPQATGR